MTKTYFRKKSLIADVRLGSKYAFGADTPLISQLQAFKNIFHLYCVTSVPGQFFLNTTTGKPHF